jgi:hypothetical protein
MAFSFGFEEATKEVELEILHRAASEISTSLFRHRRKSFEEAIDLALNDIATKYLTGIKDLDTIFKTLEINSFFKSTFEILSQLFRMCRRLQTKNVDDFGFFLKDLWKEYEAKVPFAHLLSSLVGHSLSKSPNIRYLTGNVYDPKYRAYTFAKNYPNLKFYFDSYNEFSVLGNPDVDEDTLNHFIEEFKDGLSKITPEIIEFYASIFAGLVDVGTIQEVLDHLVLLVYIKLKSWTMKDNDNVFLIFKGVFGSEETVRLELKYSGISKETDSIDTAITKLKNYLEYDLDLLPPVEKIIKDQDFTLENAIEKIAEMRNKKIVLDSSLQKKTFISGLSVDERDYFFKGLTGLNFNDYIQQMANRRKIEVNVSSLDTLAMEELFLRLFKIDAVTMMIHALNENQPASDAGAGTVAGREILIKYESVRNYLIKTRGDRVVDTFENNLKFKALINGLSDNELASVSNILFNTPGAKKEDVYDEYLKILRQKDQVKGATQVSQLDEQAEATKKVKEFCNALIKYALSPALTCFDLTIDIINWIRENVNDIFISLDSDDSFQQNLGKMVIYSLVNEVSQVFPKMKDKHYVVAFLSAMITKEKLYSDLLKEIGEESKVLAGYTQIQRTFPKDAQPWTIANEIWIRHLQRVVKEVIPEKVIVQKLTLEEKARRAYQMAEKAAIKYTLSLRTKDGISCLTINQEESFIELLKYLRAQGMPELLATEFQLGDSLDMGTVKLRDALLQIMNEKYREELEKIIVRMEHGARFDDDTVFNISGSIIDLLNYSIIRETDYIIDSNYMDKIRTFSTKFQTLFANTNFSTKELRKKSLYTIIHDMGNDLFELIEDGKANNRLNFFNETFNSVLEFQVLDYIVKLNKIPEGTAEYSVQMENFARYLYGKGIKRNSFTVLLNHLMAEEMKGTAEIGSDYWKRYADRCRYILRRIEKTVQVLKK